MQVSQPRLEVSEPNRPCEPLGTPSAQRCTPPWLGLLSGFRSRPRLLRFVQAGKRSISSRSLESDALIEEQASRPALLLVVPRRRLLATPRSLLLL
jgi:hypothetical protein